jgi:AmmeMemoRadiSam system protein B/AmmeMemoRadiSam system protein A
MRIFKFIFLVFFLGSIAPNVLNAQETANRKAYAAGKFYEADLPQLLTHLYDLFSETRKLNKGNVLAIISPHAGYAYSGEVAAWGFKQIDAEKKFRNIFILASSHTMAIPGASIYTAGNYETPLGEVKVNIKLANSLIHSNPYLIFQAKAHVQEHSIENQLPFLQYYLEKDFQIVPILIGTDNKKAIKSIANSLKPYLNENNLFVISSDFSHYPKYRDAQKADSLTAFGILSNDVSEFEDAIRRNAQNHYPGLLTSACGRTALLTLMNISENMPDVKFVPLKYANSGDVSFGDKNRVVGYFSLLLTQKNKQISNEFLTQKDKEDLLNIARFTIEEYLNKGIIPKLDPGQFSENLKKSSGAFVTLNKKHRLRGCIGRFFSNEALYKVVQEMAIAAATQDYRFQQLTPDELNVVSIEISVLTPIKKLQSIDELKLGRDGIYIVKGKYSGTYLPQVATETGWTKEEFLGHCAQDKAGIGWDGWKNAEIFTYQAIVFSEGE